MKPQIIPNFLILLAIINVKSNASTPPFTEEEFFKRTKALLNIRMPTPERSLRSRSHSQNPGSSASFDTKIKKIQTHMDDPELIALRAILLCENQETMNSKTFMGLWTKIYQKFKSPKEFLYIWYMHQGKFDKKFDNSPGQIKYSNLINRLRNIYTTKTVDAPNEAYLKVYAWGLLVERFNCKALEWIDISAQHWSELPPRKALWFGEFVKSMPNDHWFIQNMPFWMLYNIIGYYCNKIDFSISRHPPEQILQEIDNEYSKYLGEFHSNQNMLQDINEDSDEIPLKSSGYNAYDGDLSLYRFADWFNSTLKNLLIAP